MEKVEGLLVRIGFEKKPANFVKDTFKVSLQDEYLVCKSEGKTLFKVEASLSVNILLALFQEYNAVEQDTLDEMWEEDFLENY